MRKIHLNWRAGLLTAFLAAGFAFSGNAAPAVKNVMCLKTNTGRYIPVVRVSMMVVPDGGKTFEILLKDGPSETNVSEVSFEKHEEEIDFNKYKENADGTPYVDLTKKIYLITNTGKYFTFSNLPTMTAQEGTNKFDISSGSVVEKDVTNVYFYRGEDIEGIIASGISDVLGEQKEELTLATPISSEMTISGCGNATIAEVYTTGGVKMLTAPVENGVATIQVGSLNRGVYIVSVGRKALKFMKK